MNRDEMLQMQAMEECAELAQRFSKALRFGMLQKQDGQEPTNLDSIYEEYFDLRAVMGMCGIDAWVNNAVSQSAEQAKVAKVEKYLQRSRDLGRLADGENKSSWTYTEGKL